MLRLAVMSLSYQRAFAAGTMDLFSYIQTSRELGLDGVDLHGRHFVSTDTDYLWRLKRACIERGLTIACVSIPNNFAGAAESLPAELDEDASDDRRGGFPGRTAGAGVCRLERAQG